MNKGKEKTVKSNTILFIYEQIFLKIIVPKKLFVHGYLSFLF